jgi:RND family efflux transporter MFP subunit
VYKRQEGDRVKKYQAIASLDKEQLRKSLQSQFNNYRTQLSQFWDVQDNYKDTIVTDTIQRILNRTQYSLDNSVINYEISDMAIKEATIVSPFSGVVVEADQSLVGTNITPTTSFTIINPDSIYLRAEVDQEDVTKIKIGQKATLSIDSYPDQKIDSQITYIAFTPVAGESSVVYEVRFKLPLDNSNLNYRYGMDASATITLAEAKNVLTLPLDALNSEAGKNFVWIKNNDRLSKAYVSTGIESDTDIQILEGLNPNDSVVIKQL